MDDERIRFLLLPVVAGLAVFAGLAVTEQYFGAPERTAVQAGAFIMALTVLLVNSFDGEARRQEEKARWEEGKRLLEEIRDSRR